MCQIVDYLDKYLCSSCIRINEKSKQNVHKMTDGGHFGWADNINYRIRPRSLELGSNTSKVIALATKIVGDGVGLYMLYHVYDEIMTVRS